LEKSASYEARRKINKYEKIKEGEGKEGRKRNLNKESEDGRRERIRKEWKKARRISCSMYVRVRADVGNKGGVAAQCRSVCITVRMAPSFHYF
jgi:hypothetical protein